MVNNISNPQSVCNHLAHLAMDSLTRQHCQRVCSLVTNMAQVLDLEKSTRRNLRLFGLLHDIGKVGVKLEILQKKGVLTTEERNEMEQHSTIGYLIALKTPGIKAIASWILMHHEWWNGQGYPLGLKKTKIPLVCRILSIADAYDAMTSHRPYRRAMTSLEAFRELKRGAGTQFDPYLLEVFLAPGVSSVIFGKTVH